jgi:energy-coupling factor transporter ATP-binding protein EcfA2
MKIEKIHISDFKFFDTNRTINVGTKHLLVYGENGSGKSSIYWALYTLLDSAIKDNRAQIEKYFNKRNPDVLLNVYARNNRNAKIKIELENGDIYEVNPTTFDILENNAINIKAQEINLASDFINYRMLYRFHDLKHSKTFDVFDFFLQEVLMYLTVPVLANKRADKIWKKLNEGPEKGYDLNGDNIFPIADDLSVANPAMQDLQKKYKDYRNELYKFNTWFKQLIESVETEANSILQTELSQPFRIKLTYKKAVSQVTRTTFNLQNPQIIIGIPEWNGLRNKIKKPHSFLNEARLTALAFSIRLGILKSRLSVADLRLLTMDDLLISLDMGNRDKVQDIVIKRLSSDFQLIILTHDYIFFEFTKDKIDKHNKVLKAANQPELKWQYLEMYEHEDNGQLKPWITESKTAFDKAKKYQKQLDLDLPASANYLRKACEEFCEKYLPPASQFDGTGKKLNLNNLLAKLPAESVVKGHPLPLFQKLDSYRQTIFNPQSHYNLNNPPLYRSEIKDVIKSLEDLMVLTGINL